MNLVYGYDGDLTQNTFVDNEGKPIKVTNEDRKKCLSYMIDSDRRGIRFRDTCAVDAETRHQGDSKYNNSKAAKP